MDLLESDTKACIVRIIRRNLRNASMTGVMMDLGAFPCGEERESEAVVAATGRTSCRGNTGACAQPRAGLESDKKTHQVAGVGSGFGAPLPSP
jgi:hypothetical protein